MIMIKLVMISTLSEVVNSIPKKELTELLALLLRDGVRNLRFTWSEEGHELTGLADQCDP